jgi:hypothetical protein
MFQLELLTVELLPHSVLVFNSKLFKSVIIPFVIVEFLLVEMHDLVACHIEELSGVGDDDDCALAVCNVVFEPHDSVQIQMVGWLVEQKDVWFNEKGTGECHSHSPTA